jgi:hypothetical protein
MDSEDAKSVIGAGTVKANQEKVQSDFQKEAVAKLSDAGQLVEAGSVQARRQSFTSKIANPQKDQDVKKTWDDASTLISSGRVKERMAKFKQNLAASSSSAQQKALQDRREAHRPSRKGRDSSASA